jgi:hypothetical protein
VSDDKEQSEILEIKNNVIMELSQILYGERVKVLTLTRELSRAKKLIEVQGKEAHELQSELELNQQAFKAFGIHKNDIGFWQDRSGNMD